MMVTCPVCGRSIRLTNDGRFVQHTMSRDPGAPTCPKSRKKPR